MGRNGQISDTASASTRHGDQLLTSRFGRIARRSDYGGGSRGMPSPVIPATNGGHCSAQRYRIANRRGVFLSPTGDIEKSEAMNGYQPPARGDVIQHEVLSLDQPEATPGRRAELHWRVYASGEWDVWLDFRAGREGTGLVSTHSVVTLQTAVDGTLRILTADSPLSATRVLHTIPAAECLPPVHPCIEHQLWPLEPAAPPPPKDKAT